jgi:predicted small lipoprotein YifL
VKAKQVLVGVALVTAVAACGNAGAPLLPPAAPSLDGGHTLGGGARVNDSTTTMQTDTTQRGGHTIGAGT